MSIGKRIADLITKKKISNAGLARAIDVSRPTIGNWIEGKSMPSGENLNNLANALGVDPNWLVTGEPQPKLSIPAQAIEEWDADTPLENDEVEIKFFKDFKLACGSGNIGDALESEWRRLRLSKTTLRNLGIEFNNAVAMTADGDSMEPEIKDGATVYLDLGRKTIKDGKVFAICHGGLFKFKRLYALPLGGIRIVSDNSEEYPEERLTAQEIIDQEFNIIGWAWSWQSIEKW